LPFLSSLENLKLGALLFITSDIFKSLIHLKTLDISQDDDDLDDEMFILKYGKNLQILDHLKQIELVKLRIYEYLNINEIQKKYSHVRFQWFIEYENGTSSVYEDFFRKE
jgi:hypothetical protein